MTSEYKMEGRSGLGYMRLPTPHTHEYTHTHLHFSSALVLSRALFSHGREDTQSNV